MKLQHKVILGTVQFGLPYGINNQLGQPSQDTVNAILNLAYDNGINLLDTAESYGNAQKVIGNFHRSFPEKVFSVITKLNPKSSFKNIKEQIFNDIIELNVNSLAGLMFHSFNDYIDHLEGFDEMKELKAIGVIDRIGVSVYNNEEFKFLIDEGIVDLIQLPFNIFDNMNHRGELIKAAKLKGIELHVRSVFLQGLFFMNPDNLNSKLLPLKPYLKYIHDLVNNSETTIEEVCLAYTIGQKDIDMVLMGVETVDQLESNLNVIRKIEISEDFMSKINSIKVVEKELLSPVNWK